MNPSIALANPTQLLLRHTAQFKGPALVIDPPDAASIAAIAGVVPAAFLLRDYAVFRAARQLTPSTDCRFAPWPDPTLGPFRQALVYLPKGKELLAMTLAIAAPLLEPEGELWLVGGNNEGIRSAARALEGLGTVTKIESARHCSLFSTAVSKAPPPFNPEAWESIWRLAGLEEELAIASLPGVFSQGRLDEGTQRLLQCMHLPTKGRALDLGCGAGVVGTLLARRCPQCQIELVDANALAIEATRRTLAANRIANARVYPSDVFSDVQGHFDFIVSNPPFHTHVKTDYRVHQELIHGAKRHLTRGGLLQIVVNRFLKIEPMLAAVFGQVGIDFEDNKYRVYRVQQD